MGLVFCSRTGYYSLSFVMLLLHVGEISSDLQNSQFLTGSMTQLIVSLSTMNPDFVALAYGIKECIGLKQLVLESEFDSGDVIDQAAQHIAEGNGVSQHSRHIEPLYLRIREQVQLGEVDIRY
ncbi:uncharacterized protein PHALS_05542 [Plasmopara halstedii]|uniref:Uncharacterized protein n=1 Tax=Plasmopara halstedii TaxID=4781 RepID=A0A0P1B226_PLAHL|nr:uncharacterized protein PHALS_05542 [Plasmopara halstedii]CEG48066.1 hypothetical protein PHALS_05542 [Plasmopara halstedii]|eukprot:XP_024584435.1 hypothetical protein PHALS_05542 [Plasmopara halstedii]